MKNINLTLYFIGTWLFSVFLCTEFLHDIFNETLRDHVHTVLVLLTYGTMYQAPAVISYWFLKSCRVTAICIAILFSILGHLFDLYGFHINGFVWNLLSRAFLPSRVMRP